jgi:hypothetical protein
VYGDIVLEVEDGGLVLRYAPDYVADLERWHHDTFRAVWRNRAMREEFVWFTTGPDGRPDAVYIQWSLRPVLLQVGAYPTDYYRITRMERLRR